MHMQMRSARWCQFLTRASHLGYGQVTIPFSLSLFLLFFVISALINGSNLMYIASWDKCVSIWKNDSLQPRVLNPKQKAVLIAVRSSPLSPLPSRFIILNILNLQFSLTPFIYNYIFIHLIHTYTLQNWRQLFNGTNGTILSENCDVEETSSALGVIGKLVSFFISFVSFVFFVVIIIIIVVVEGVVDVEYILALEKNGKIPVAVS